MGDELNPGGPGSLNYSAIHAVLGFGEPSATELFLRDAGEVWLDVEDGSSVEHVDSPDMQTGTFAADQFDYGEPDRVGTSWGTRGEDSMGTIVGRRLSDQFEFSGAVEGPQNNQVREAFNVGEAGFELRQNLEGTFGFVFRPEAFGDFL